MQKANAIKYYGNIVKLASILAITHGAVCQWRDIIPEKQAMRLALITKGELVYQPELYRSSEVLAPV